MTKVYQGEINADLIINGSSKALVQVDPTIIDSILGTNSYNLGLDGSPFIPQKALFELYIRSNKKPKIVVQVVSNGTLRSLDDGFLNPVKFAPYLEIPEVKKHIKLTGAFSSFDYIVPLLKYSGSPFELSTGLLSLFNITLIKNEDIKGYMPNKTSWQDKEKNHQDQHPNQIVNTPPNISQKIKEFTLLDSISCSLFEKFLEECRISNIIVFVVFPPIHHQDSYTIKNNAYYSLVAKKYNAYFLDYSRDSSFVYNKDYFYNTQHLNIRGAKKFSNRLATDIKEKFFKK